MSGHVYKFFACIAISSSVYIHSIGVSLSNIFPLLRVYHYCIYPFHSLHQSGPCCHLLRRHVLPLCYTCGCGITCHCSCCLVADPSYSHCPLNLFSSLLLFLQCLFKLVAHSYHCSMCCSNHLPEQYL